MLEVISSTPHQQTIIRNSQMELERDVLDFLTIENSEDEARAMADLFPIWRFKTIICKLARDEEWLNQVLSSSYIHENGFLKIVLLSVCGAKLRIHYRPPILSGNPPMENIHMHRWSFASAILAGKLEVQTFGDVEMNSDVKGSIVLDEYVYRSANGRDFYTVIPLKQTRLVTLATESYAANSTYSVDNKVLHRVMSSKVGGGGYITMVITRPPISDHCRLLSDKEIDVGEVDTVKISKKQLLYYLDCMLACTA